MIGAVDTDALLELVWAAPLAALIVTFSMACVVLGATCAAEAHRDGRRPRAVLGVALAIGGALLFTAAIAVGLYIMASKR